MANYIHDGFTQKYQDENGKLFRLTIKADNDESMNPRTEYDNVGTMVCFHRRYNLGDKHDYSSPDDFLSSLVRNNVPEKDIVSFVKAGKGNVFVQYDRQEKDYSVSEQTKNGWKYSFSTDKERIADDVIDMLSFDDCLSLLEKSVVILPLYLYDHSGITMSTGSFNDPWDSGQVGWIYCTKEHAEKELNTKGKGWKQAAIDCLESEVQTYDYYIMGDVYGFTIEEQTDSEADEWEETDSCWGFIGDTLENSGIDEHIPNNLKPVA